DSLDQSNSNITYTLTAPDSSIVASSYTYYDNGPFILPLSGTYTLTLNNTSGSSRSYSLRLIDLATAATNVSLGATASGPSIPQGVDVYSFTGSVGQNLYYDGLSDASGGAVTYRFTGPSGQSLQSGTSLNDNVVSTFVESGTYYLIQSNGGTSNPNYSFRLL